MFYCRHPDGPCGLLGLLLVRIEIETVRLMGLCKTGTWSGFGWTIYKGNPDRRILNKFAKILIFTRFFLLHLSGKSLYWMLSRISWNNCGWTRTKVKTGNGLTINHGLRLKSSSSSLLASAHFFYLNFPVKLFYFFSAILPHFSPLTWTGRLFILAHVFGGWMRC